MKNIPKILLVEDEESFKEVIKKFLGVFYDIQSVSTLKEARELLVTQQNHHNHQNHQTDTSYFEIILLDKGLPDGNGLELLEEIRLKNLETIIIILTGDSDFNAANKCINLGANDYVIKSEDIVQELLIRISMAIKTMSLHKELKFFQKVPALQLPSHLNDINSEHYQQYMSKAEREYLRMAFQFCEGDVSNVANKLGLSRSTIFNKMTALGIEKRSWTRRNFLESEKE